MSFKPWLLPLLTGTRAGIFCKQCCEKLQVSPVDANKLFEKYGIWKYIEDTYDMLHLSSDEYALKNILEILRVNGVNYEA